MNYKLLLSVSLLSLLAVSTYMVVLRQKTEVEAGQTRATYEQWQQCKKELNYNPFCNQYKDSSKNEACQNAQAEVTYCERYNHDCNMFAIYYEEPTEDAPLPNCFYGCVNACQRFSSGDSYYQKNYNIAYKECAYTN